MSEQSEGPLRRGRGRRGLWNRILDSGQSLRESGPLRGQRLQQWRRSLRRRWWNWLEARERQRAERIWQREIRDHAAGQARATRRGGAIRALKGRVQTLWSAWQSQRLVARVRATSIRDLLARGGWCMLVLFAARLFTTLVPFQVMSPDWYMRLGSELINTSPVLLTGLSLLAAVGILNRRMTGERAQSQTMARRVLRAALWAYLLVIPAQALSTVMVDRRVQDGLTVQWQRVQQQLAAARRRNAGQGNTARLDQLRTIEARLQEQRGRRGRELRFNLYRELIRVCISALALVWAMSLPLRALDEANRSG